MPRFFLSAKTLSQFSAALVLAVLSLCLVVMSVAAHAEYRSSTPGNGTTVSTPLTQVVITFSQETSVTQSKGQVTDASGTVVSPGPATVDLNDRTKLTIPLKPGLTNGIYTVSYTSQSQDMHVVDGSYIFTLALAPTASANGAPWGTWLIVFAGATLVILGGLWFVRRQARALDAPAVGAGQETGERN